MITLEQFAAATGARYGRPPNDGAKWRCADCGQLFSHTGIYCTVTPNNTRQMLCDGCLDSDWKAAALNCGQLK